MSKQSMLEEQWYYKIEIDSGTSTSGRPIGTLPTVRRIVDAIDFEGSRVLDIGTQEFVAPILMESKNPAEIIAYDRLSLTDRFDLISKTYNLTRTKYVHGIPFQELKKELKKKKIEIPFDIVFFTGVLYHMADPLPGIAMARSMLRNNGLMVLETSVAAREGFTIDCNHHAALYSGSNYFQVSPQALDYWCRMLRLRPIDVFWHGGEDIKRMFLIMKATDSPVAELEDRWIRKGFLTEDFKPFGLNYEELSSDKPEIEYNKLEGLGSLRYTDTKPRFLDVWETLNNRRPARPDAEKAVVTLKDKVS